VVESGCLKPRFSTPEGLRVRQSTTTACVSFQGLFPKPILARFDQPRGSSDGGGILLRAADRWLGLSERLSDCLEDSRQSSKVVHELGELLRQRLFAIALGYPDANDAARLADDPIHKLLVGRDPVTGPPLASQPTLSRFENGIARRTLFRLGEALADTVIAAHRLRRRRAHTVTLDLDVTDDPTHGAQQLSFFHGYYDTWCYLPLLAFLSFDEEPEQYLVAALLRPGNAPTQRGVLGLLQRLLPRLRRAFPHAQPFVRLDSGFASPQLLDWLDAHNVDYVVGMPANPALQRRAAVTMEKVRARAHRRQQTATHYTSFWSAAKTWPRRRRIVLKAEVVCAPGKPPRDNPRFLVTNLPNVGEWVYRRAYCRRGDIENRIKELDHGLALGRTSCSRFWANQLRVLLTAGAYVLLQELRRRAAHTSCARAQVATLREHLLKIGVHVVGSVRRLVLHLPRSFPFLLPWQRIAASFGAAVG
jgi:hypothetical protein